VSGESVLIVGATSSIARALAHEYAAAGQGVVLAGRDAEELEFAAADLRVRHGVPARAEAFDALDFAAHAPLVERCFADPAGAPEGVVVCLGYLGDQARAQAEPDEARRILDSNFTACVSLLNEVANRMEARRSGFICVLASVAGDRGRQSNYIYGAAKGGLAVYLQGLRNRLFHSGVKVITVKPGFVDTQMTFGRPGLFLVAPPETVARGIRRAVSKGRDTVYLPGFWRGLMMVIRSIPEPVFKRLKL
jgi:decaprenylphospho-beta-D-erythro-pentofuranosid-2-ulose 2-reductase